MTNSQAASSAGWVVPLADVTVDDELRSVVDEVADSGWWSMGPKVEEFEAAFAGFTDTKHALAVANGTAALRDEVRAALADRRIQTSVHYPPIHLFSYYEELGSRRPLPRTEEVAERVVTLPLYGHMTDEQADLVIDALLESAGVDA
jgi:dTDP-4-amino-4,6-dideoxygalactose transaminase